MRNKEHYKDPTADLAIARADKPPEAVAWLRKTFREIASLIDCDVCGEITVTDRRTKRRWKITY